MVKKSPFNQKFLSEVKGMLVSERQRLEKELLKFAKKNSHISGEYDAVLPEYGDDEDDNAREVADFTSNKPLEISLESTLRDVAKSLKRLDEGTYGICKYCDKPIDEKRLLARPTSGSCVECKKTLTQEA